MSGRSSQHLRRGLYAEQLAEQYLVAQGFGIIVRNFKCPQGEIDLIVMRDKTVHFVEVKGRWSRRMGHPLDQVNRSKMLRIARAAQRYLQDNAQFDAFRLYFSVLGVDAAVDPPAISWVPNAFDLPFH